MITRAEGERKECFEAILRKCKENEEKRGDAYFVFIFGEIGSTINLTKLLHIGCTKKKKRITHQAAIKRNNFTYDDEKNSFQGRGSRLSPNLLRCRKTSVP